MLDRILDNWKTTVAGIIPMIVVLAGWLGFGLDPAKLLILANGFYVILLLLSKDTPKEE